MFHFIHVLLKDTGADVEIISFKVLRKWVGILGVVLPFALVTGSKLLSDCTEILPSISHYYYSNVTVVFVGILCAVSFFLITYSGYSRLDNILTNIAAIFCLGVTLFPTGFKSDIACLKLGNQLIKVDLHVLHFVCAVGFFTILACMSIWIFTRSNPAIKEMSPEKKIRNRIYVFCGVIMLLSEVMIGLHNLSSIRFLSYPEVTFWLETVMLIAFGFSWLTKGEVIVADK